LERLTIIEIAGRGKTETNLELNWELETWRDESVSAGVGLMQSFAKPIQANRHEYSFISPHIFGVGHLLGHASSFVR
jgi:hypothetical protein